MTPRTPGSTVALYSPCLIVMDEPRVCSLALIYGTRRTVHVCERPGRSHLNLPESDVAPVSTLPYPTCRVRQLADDIYEYTRDEEIATAAANIISRCCRSIYF